MYIPSVHTSWRHVEPYIVPACIVTGTALVINQLWGSVAACGFAASVAGISIAFPFIMTEITKQDLALSVARLTLIAILPFFGTWGILATVTLVAASSFTQDIRLYNIRAMLKEANGLADQVKRDQEQLIALRKEMLEECTAKHKSAEEFWQKAEPLKEVQDSINRYKALAQQNREFFDKVIQDLNMQGQNEEAQKVVQTIEMLEKTVAHLTAQYTEWIGQHDH